MCVSEPFEQDASSGDRVNHYPKCDPRKFFLYIFSRTVLLWALLFIEEDMVIKHLLHVFRRIRVVKLILRNNRKKIQMQISPWLTEFTYCTICRNLSQIIKIILCCLVCQVVLPYTISFILKFSHHLVTGKLFGRKSCWKSTESRSAWGKSSPVKFISSYARSKIYKICCNIFKL